MSNLVYIPLPDVLAGTRWASTLSEVHALHRLVGDRSLPNPGGSGTSVGWPASGPAWRLGFFPLLISPLSGALSSPSSGLYWRLPGRLPLSYLALDPTCP